MNERVKLLRAKLDKFCDDVGVTDPPTVVAENKLYRLVAHREWCRMHGTRVSSEASIDQRIYEADLNEANLINSLLGEINRKGLTSYGKENPISYTPYNSGVIDGGTMAAIADYAESVAGSVIARYNPSGNGGRCWPAVYYGYIEPAARLEKIFYGNMTTVPFPQGAADEPRQFAALLNSGAAERYGLVRLPIFDPRQAPRGSLVILNPFGKSPGDPPNPSMADPNKGIPEQFRGLYRTNGTWNRTAGDISISMGNGRGLNDHRVTYYPNPTTRNNAWVANNTHLAGVWAPVKKK